MDFRIIIVAAIMLGTGLAGGVGAYLAQSPAARANETRSAVFPFLILGIIAAGCVPLFLSLVQSSVVDTIFGATVDRQGAAVAPAYESYLIFIGLCLIAAFSSRQFISSITDKLFKRLDEVDETARGAAAAAADARQVAHEVVEEVEAADDRHGIRPLEALFIGESEDPRDEAAATPLTQTERRVLLAMTKRTMRTLTGIAEDSQVSRNKISELIDDLADRKLVKPVTSPRTGGPRWAVTGKGVAALNAALGSPAPEAGFVA